MRFCRDTITARSGSCNRHFSGASGCVFSGVGGPASESTVLVGETTEGLWLGQGSAAWGGVGDMRDGGEEAGVSVRISALVPSCAFGDGEADDGVALRRCFSGEMAAGEVL